MKDTSVLLAAMLVFTGCSADSTKISDLKPEVQNTLVLPVTAPYNSGFYYLSLGQSALCYAENCEKPVKITDLAYNDDLPASEKPYFEKYTDHILMNNLYVLNESILNADGQSSYHLYSMTPDGQKRKEEMAFPYEPIQFLLHRNTLFCVEYCADGSSLLHVYDGAYKEMTTIKENAPIYSLFADGNAVYCMHQDAVSEEDEVRRYLLDTQESETVLTGSFDFANNGRMAYHTLSRPFLFDTDPMDITVTSQIQNLEDGSLLFTVADEFIRCFDDACIYTSTIKENHVAYHVYGWDGELLQTIIPSETISGEYLCHDGWVRQDFSGIVHVIDGQIIACADTPAVYISCSMDSGACRVIPE